jgi:hypothetical protein
MRRNYALASRERAICMEQVQASIGRWLRDEYDLTQPLPDHLGDLVRRIGSQPSNTHKEKMKLGALPASPGRWRAQKVSNS